MTIRFDSSVGRDGRMTCPLQRDHLESRFCEVIPSTIEALNAIEENVMAVIRNFDCAPGDLLGVSLSLREALANAVLHGNRKDPTKRVLVACFCDCETDGGLLLVIQDEGPGFDINAVPDPRDAEAIHSWHGRGIYLMHHFMDDVNYALGGREVRLRKRRSITRIVKDIAPARSLRPNAAQSSRTTETTTFHNNESSPNGR